MSHNSAASRHSHLSDAAIAASVWASVMLQLRTDCNNESVCIMKGDMALHMLLDSKLKYCLFFNKQEELMQLQ